MNYYAKRSVQRFTCLAFLASNLLAWSHPDDWAEGAAGWNDGATRDFYNRAALLPWENHLGDWRDADDRAQGDRPYAAILVPDTDSESTVSCDVTDLVRTWLTGRAPNQGFFLRGVDGRGPLRFRSREFRDVAKRPALVLEFEGGNVTVHPAADTFLDASTYRSLGDREELVVGRKGPHALLRFELDTFSLKRKLNRVILKLSCHEQYGGGMTLGVYRCRQGAAKSNSEPRLGIAARYPGDQGIANDPEVLFFSGFDRKDWERDWSHAGGTLHPTASDPALRFSPLAGPALRAQMSQGKNLAMSLTYKFADKQGGEPDEVYFRYYLRLGDDWNQTLQGGKMPGISGTYGIAGWGGRKSDGRNGWSARGAFFKTIPESNPLAGRHPIGTYCYHADQPGTYGDTWIWNQGLNGFLEKNRWYTVEQYLKLNTPGEKDGILRAWVDGRPAFEKTDIRFRLVDRLKIEQIWMNVYHGGKKASPHDQHLYIDHVVVARKYIGPMHR